MSTIGSLLKDARNKKAVSLEEVHSRTKIHPHVLQLLEEDKFDKLPSPLFVKSFLKSYAEFLEVNSQEIVRAYEKEGAKEPTQEFFIRPAAEREQKAIFNFDKSLLVVPALILALLAGGSFVFFLVKKTAHPSHEKKTANTLKSVKANAAKQKSRPAKAATDGALSTSDWLRHPSLGNFPKLIKKDALRLQIKAADTVWLRVTSDGKVLFQSILKRGVTETWTANDHFEIWTGNASEMALTLNNYFIGSPGQGVIRKMLINHEGVRIAS